MDLTEIYKIFHPHTTEYTFRLKEISLNQTTTRGRLTVVKQFYKNIS